MEFCSLLEHVIVGISLLYLVYFNASIYLVKGGRLGPMPDVLFHSCHPSFRHTGVMFLDFAFLVAGGDEVCSMLEHGYVGISKYLLFN